MCHSRVLGGNNWDVHAQYLRPFSWPEEVHRSTIAFGECDYIRESTTALDRWIGGNAHLCPVEIRRCD